MIENVNGVVSDVMAKRLNAGVDHGKTIAECWEWNGCRFSTGYGCITSSGKNIRAHRIAWIMHNGMQIPDGLVVRHSCDNRACCNPYHLSLGTIQDNSDDKVSRRRQSQGETHGMAKLTLDDAKAIASSEDSYKTLSEKYGVTKTTIWRIKTGSSWCGFDIDGVTSSRPREKLDAYSAREVFLADGMQKEIAERFGITQKQVSYIKSGKAWAKATADLRGE